MFSHAIFNIGFNFNFNIKVIAERFRKAYPLGSTYINTYDNRPMFNFHTERNKRYTTLSYVNAVRREANPPLTAEELRHAYHVAGNSFVGQLKETFLVLDDDAAKKQANSGGGKGKASKAPSSGNKSAKANKRRASGEGPSDPKKKIPATQ